MFIRSQRLELVIMSKLTKQLWKLAHKMWEQWNKILHEEGSTVHQHELRKLDEAIEVEFSRGAESLNTKYSHLFRGTIQT